MLYPAYRALSTALEVIPGSWRGAEPPVLDSEIGGVIHGASAGETKAACALRRILNQDRPGQRWLISTGTVTGLESGADFRLPRDLPGRTARVFSATKMRSLLLIEAEFWPNLLTEAATRGVAVGVAGARMSPVSHSRMQRLPASTSKLLSSIGAFAAASDSDASRLHSLGVPAEKVAVCGWLKWPVPAPRVPLEELSVFHQSPPRLGRPLLVLGSVYPGEVTALASALRDSPFSAGKAYWQLVPRHARHGASLRREAASLCPPETFSVDARFGVLRAWYAHADAAYVGGGLFGRGCHDLLEPVAMGLRPLCHLRTGDPGSVAATLLERDLAVCLEETPQSAEVGATAGHSYRIPEGAFEELKGDMDGRQKTMEFFQSRGVLS